MKCTKQVNICLFIILKIMLQTFTLLKEIVPIFLLRQLEFTMKSTGIRHLFLCKAFKSINPYEFKFNASP